MNAFQNQEHADGKKVADGAEGLLSALDALHPAEQQQRQALFSKAYPGIVRAIARKVPQKDILVTLSHSGLKLHPVRYRDMLETERRRRDEHGNPVSCDACGQALHPLSTSEMAPSENDPADNTMASQLLHSLKGETA